MQRVLVTGASGFIGNYVVKELLHKNVHIIATSTNTEKARNFSWFSEVQYIPFNLEQFSSEVNYISYFHHPTHLIHLAWEGLPNFTSSFHVEENLPRHYRFLANLVLNGLQDLTITGTCLEYGLKEGLLKEDDAAHPITSYGQAKNSLRLQLQKLSEKKPIIIKWVRLFYMYGKGQNSNSLLSQLQQAIEANATSFNMSGGEQVRDYLPVEVVAKNIVKIALQDKVTGIINCSSNKPVTVKTFVADYLKENHKKIDLNLGVYPYPAYEAMEFWGDNSKLKSIKDI